MSRAIAKLAITHYVAAGLPMLRLPIKRHDALIAAAILALTAPAVGAQEGEVDNPYILDCDEGGEGGCRYMEASGEHTKEEISLILGKEDPHGHNTVVCHGLDCDWSPLSPKTVHLTTGGSGEPEGEHQDPMIFSEDELVSDEMIFSEDEVGPKVCPGVTMSIPGGREASGRMRVSEDGNEATLEALGPELTNVPMRRAGPALFVGEVDIQADGGTMALQYVTGFLDADFALGLIYAELEQQGTTCTIERRFIVSLRGAEPLGMSCLEVVGALGAIEGTVRTVALENFYDNYAERYREWATELDEFHERAPRSLTGAFEIFVEELQGFYRRLASARADSVPPQEYSEWSEQARLDRLALIAGPLPDFDRVRAGYERIDAWLETHCFQ